MSDTDTPASSASRDIEHVVPAEDAGTRVDRFLAQQYPNRSRAFIQKAINDSAIHLNGTPCKPAATVARGDTVTGTWPAEQPNAIVEEPVDFDVLYEDNDLIVINKPAGLVVHPNKNERRGTLVHGLLHRNPDAFHAMLDRDQRPGIVHRLDKETSGAMVVAKNERAWIALKRAFKERHVEKNYLTLVIGDFGADYGRIDNLIGRHPKNRRKMAVVDENGKRAVTNYRVLGRSQGITLLDVRIETGRTHQIRVHFADLRHPILGDHVYGGKPKELPVKAARQMLHAWKLVIPHPTTGELREFTATPPDDFQTVLQQLDLPTIGKQHYTQPAP